MESKFEFQWINDVDSLKENSDQIIDMLNASVIDDGMLGYGENLSSSEEQSFLKFWEWQISNQSAQILLVHDGIGACAMGFMRTNSNSNYKHIADLSKGYLRPRVRGSTALLQMFARICDKGRELGVELLTLDTRENSKAYQVWRHFGFEIYGTLPDYSRFRGTRHTGSFMQQSINKFSLFLNERLNRS